jgi:hypothetical protein
MPVITQNLSAADREQLGNVAAWARQTIAFAMSVLNSATTNSLDDENTNRLAAQEAEHLATDIWEEAAKECPVLPEALIVYAEMVFEWCYKHMKRNK